MKRLCVLVLVAALALAACGGSDDDNDALAGTNDSNNSVDNADNGDSSRDDEYEQLLERAKSAKIRVTYKVSSGGNDEVLTFSSNGEGKQAYFYDDGDSHAITDGERYIVCNDVNSDPTCGSYENQSGAAGLLGYATLLGLPALAARGADGPLTDTSNETIAGREAVCISLNYLGDTWKSCADKETGIGLLWQTSGGGGSATFEATEVGDPQDSDFEPDAEPTEMTIPSIPNITLPGGGTIPGFNG